MVEVRNVWLTRESLPAEISAVGFSMASAIGVVKIQSVYAGSSQADEISRLVEGNAALCEGESPISASGTDRQRRHIEFWDGLFADGRHGNALMALPKKEPAILAGSGGGVGGVRAYI